MTVLVTGCAGFIGSKVTERLLQQGAEVAGVDNLNSSYAVRLKQWRLEQLRTYPQFAFSQTDITDRAETHALFERNPRLKAVINMAARAGVRQSLVDPWAYYATNVIGTLNLLEEIRHFGVSKFVLASTSSVYGDGPRPFREDQQTDRPRSPYAASKKSAETLCYSYASLYGLDVTVLRYFTVYGPAGRPDMSIFRFIRWIAEGDPLILYGDGSQERDFTYVEDAAAGTVAALQREGYDVINLGSDRPVSIRDVITHLERLLERKAKITLRPVHPADVPATWADISRARRMLDWEPRTPLLQGLEHAVQWYRANRSWAAELPLEQEA